MLLPVVSALLLTAVPLHDASLPTPGPTPAAPAALVTVARLASPAASVDAVAPDTAPTRAATGPPRLVAGTTRSARATPRLLPAAGPHLAPRPPRGLDVQAP